jgi:hypothetical protein
LRNSSGYFQVNHLKVLDKERSKPDKAIETLNNYPAALVIFCNALQRVKKIAAKPADFIETGTA